MEQIKQKNNGNHKIMITLFLLLLGFVYLLTSTTNKNMASHNQTAYYVVIAQKVTV